MKDIGKIARSGSGLVEITGPDMSVSGQVDAGGPDGTMPGQMLRRFSWSWSETKNTQTLENTIPIYDKHWLFLLGKASSKFVSTASGGHKYYKKSK